MSSLIEARNLVYYLVFLLRIAVYVCIPPSVSAWIISIYRLIPTVREHVRPEDALPCAGKCVRVDEPAYLGVIVPALEVVESHLLVEIVPPVADRVDVGHGTGGTEHLAPGVVGVFGHAGACGVHNADDITLEILAVEVLRLGAAGNVGEADDLTPGVTMWDRGQFSVPVFVGSEATDPPHI